MKKPLTKMDALRECYNLWKWLSKPENNERLTPYGNKRRWPGWSRFRKKYTLNEQDWIDTLCPICTFSHRESVAGRLAPCRERCIVPVFAKNGSCLAPESPYTRYEKALTLGNIEEACMYAKVISDSARSAMRKKA